MKESTLRLVAIVSILYFAFLILGQSLFSQEFNVPLYFLLAPILLVFLVLARDLSERTTVPSKTNTETKIGRKVSWKVQQLTRQIEVGTKASGDYYQAVLETRLRAILVEKVSLETGIERDLVQERLNDKILGPGILRDPELYSLLYGEVPTRGTERVGALEDIVRLIEQWKA